METIPVEILAEILESLGEWDYPVAARFPTLTTSPRGGILNARLVRRCFRPSKALDALWDALFVTALEETPFLWANSDVPRLDRVSGSPYAKRMSTPTI